VENEFCSEFVIGKDRYSSTAAFIGQPSFQQWSLFICLLVTWRFVVVINSHESCYHRFGHYLWLHVTSIKKGKFYLAISISGPNCDDAIYW